MNAIVRLDARRPRRRVRGIWRPETVVADYRRRIGAIGVTLWRLLDEELFPVLRRLDVPRPRLDELPEPEMPGDLPGAVARSLARMRKALHERWKEEQLYQQALQLGKRVDRRHHAQFFEQLTGAIGVEVLVTEGFVGETLDGWARENAGLIKSIVDDAIPGIEADVAHAFEHGWRHEQLRKKWKTEGLPLRFGTLEGRAKVIARDQVGKLNGELSQKRQENVGIRRYTWTTVRDQRVRDRHASRHGKVYSWDKPPKGGHPGQAVQCRCTAEPVIDLDEILGSPNVAVPSRAKVPRAVAGKPGPKREPRRPRPKGKPAPTPEAEIVREKLAKLRTTVTGTLDDHRRYADAVEAVVREHFGPGGPVAMKKQANALFGVDVSFVRGSQPRNPAERKLFRDLQHSAATKWIARSLSHPRAFGGPIKIAIAKSRKSQDELASYRDGVMRLNPNRLVGWNLLGELRSGNRVRQSKGVFRNAIHHVRLPMKNAIQRARDIVIDHELGHRLQHAMVTKARVGDSTAGFMLGEWRDVSSRMDGEAGFAFRSGAARRISGYACENTGFIGIRRPEYWAEAHTVSLTEDASVLDDRERSFLRDALDWGRG